MFALAGVVRLTNLGVFRAIDEEDRWNWAVDFFRALLSRNLPGTLVGDGYPGIVPVWLETLWLFAASVYHSLLQGKWIGEPGVYDLIHTWGRMSHLAWQRFPIALVNTLLVVAVFGYVRRLFGRRVALVAAILISLDPFLLSDSRVNRAEALLTGLMAVSLLALLLSLQNSGRKHFIISAIFGGLAWLTKSQALVLLPMFGAITLVWQWLKADNWQHAVRRWILTLLGWASIAAIVFIALWPAAWVVPADTFHLMTKFLTRKVGAEGVKIFFLGKMVLNQDPGWLFYPVIFLLRVTPLTLVGLLLGAVMFTKNSVPQLVREKISLQTFRDWMKNSDPVVWSLVLYAVLYVAGMSLGSHKQDRFLMTIFPVMDILAALAFVRFAEHRRWQPRRLLIAGGTMLVLQLAMVLPYHPYYFSYFNPLLGGGATATKLTRIGWGEGMDRVAAYLNTLEHPETLKVSARFYKYLLNFKGTAFNLDDTGQWLQADKIVFYIQQVQRMEDPSPGVIRYFQQHVPPEKTIRINGINYAWVYPNPVQFPAEPAFDRLTDKLSLYGYRWQADADGAQVTLVWENLGQGNDPLAVQLVADDGTAVRFDCTIAPEFNPSAASPGEIVESTCRLPSQNLSPGRYSLQVVSGAENAAQTLDFPAGWAAIAVDASGRMERVSQPDAFAYLAEKTLPADAARLSRMYAAKVKLLGYRLSPAAIQPGQTLSVTLYWQAQQVLGEDDTAHVSIQAFLGENRIVLQNGVPVGGARPVTSWRPGEVVVDEWHLQLPADLPVPAAIRLDVNLFNPDTLVTWQAQNLAGEDVPGQIALLRLIPDAWQPYRGNTPLDFSFGDAIRLDGLEQTPAENGQSLDVTLYWRAINPVNDDYTAFVHLVAADGTLVAQSDVPPENGLYPTSVWKPGDMVQSFHRLSLPPDLPAGKYTLLAGLYRPGDWVRLPAVNARGEPVPDDAPNIGTFERNEK